MENIKRNNLLLQLFDGNEQTIKDASIKLNEINKIECNKSFEFIYELLQDTNYTTAELLEIHLNITKTFFETTSKSNEFKDLYVNIIKIMQESKSNVTDSINSYKVMNKLTI